MKIKDSYLLWKQTTKHKSVVEKAKITSYLLQFDPICTEAVAVEVVDHRWQLAALIFACRTLK